MDHWGAMRDAKCRRAHMTIVFGASLGPPHTSLSCRPDRPVAQCTVFCPHVERTMGALNKTAHKPHAGQQHHTHTHTFYFALNK